MVAQEILDLLVWVRVLVPEPFFYKNGAMVKRLRRRPLKAKSWVRFPLALPTLNFNRTCGFGFLFWCKKTVTDIQLLPFFCLPLN